MNAVTLTDNYKHVGLTLWLPVTLLAPLLQELELELIDYEDSGSEFTSGDDEDNADNDEQSEFDTMSNMNTG